MPKLRSLAPRLRQIDTSTTRLPPKLVDPIYNTPEFQAWRVLVLDRAGRRCEAVDRHGHRCTNATPHCTVYADHIIELRDGGLPFDPANGQCLCAMHHTNKTIAMRHRRQKGV